MTSDLRVVIVEDHRMIADAMAASLRLHFDIVGVAYDAREALALARRGRPSVIVLEPALRQSNGFDLIPDFRRTLPRAAVLVVTNVCTAGFQVRARQLGAKGFVSKMDSTDTLLRAITAVSQGQEFFRRGLDNLGSVRSCLDRTVSLTPRQLCVLHHLADGFTYKEIGLRMSVTEDTVDMHLRRIRTALGEHKTVNLLRIAARHGFVNPSSPASDSFAPTSLEIGGLRYPVT